MLLLRRAAALWEGPEKCSPVVKGLFGEEPAKQKTRRRRAQELSRASAQWRGRERRQWTATSLIGADRNQGHSRES